MQFSSFRQILCKLKYWVLGEKKIIFIIFYVNEKIILDWDILINPIFFGYKIVFFGKYFVSMSTKSQKKKKVFTYYTIEIY